MHRLFKTLHGVCACKLSEKALGSTMLGLLKQKNEFQPKPLPAEESIEFRVDITLSNDITISGDILTVTIAPNSAIAGQIIRFYVQSAAPEGTLYRLHVEFIPKISLTPGDKGSIHTTKPQPELQLDYMPKESGIYNFHVQAISPENDVISSVYAKQCVVISPFLLGSLLHTKEAQRNVVLDVPIMHYTQLPLGQLRTHGLQGLPSLLKYISKDFQKTQPLLESITSDVDMQFALHVMNMISTLWKFPFSTAKGNTRGALELADHALSDDEKYLKLLQSPIANCMDASMMMHYVLTAFGIRNYFLQTVNHTCLQVHGTTDIWVMDAHLNLAVDTSFEAMMHVRTPYRIYCFAHTNLQPKHHHYEPSMSHFREYTILSYRCRWLTQFSVLSGDALRAGYVELARNMPPATGVSA